MQRRNRHWLKGAMLATTFERSADTGLKLELFLPEKADAAGSVTLMKHRFELPGEGPRSMCQLERVTSPTGSQTGSSRLLKRIGELFGDRELHRQVCEFVIPNSVMAEFNYLGFEIQQLDESGQVLPSHMQVGRHSPDSIHLQVHRNKLKFRTLGTSTLLLLLTRKQANDRLESIGQKFGLFDRDDEASTDTLGNLLFSIISGDDSPLLTDFLEDDDA